MPSCGRRHLPPLRATTDHPLPFPHYKKFHSQIFNLFDVKQKGVIDFGDFVRALNVFHPNAPHEDKIECVSTRLDYMKMEPTEEDHFEITTNLIHQCHGVMSST